MLLQKRDGEKAVSEKGICAHTPHTMLLARSALACLLALARAHHEHSHTRLCCWHGVRKLAHPMPCHRRSRHVIGARQPHAMSSALANPTPHYWRPRTHVVIGTRTRTHAGTSTHTPHHAVGVRAPLSAVIGAQPHHCWPAHTPITANNDAPGTHARSAHAGPPCAGPVRGHSPVAGTSVSDSAAGIPGPRSVTVEIRGHSFSSRWRGGSRGRRRRTGWAPREEQGLSPTRASGLAALAPRAGLRGNFVGKCRGAAGASAGGRAGLDCGAQFARSPS